MADALAAPSASQKVLRALSDADLHCRALGGIAVALRCPVAHSAPLERSYSDLDLLVSRKHALGVADVIEAHGFNPNTSFNLINGHARIVFDSEAGGHVDVFVGAFQMCHRLDVGRRLLIESQTLTLADLFLTKAQIAELTMKDVTDLTALLYDHELTHDDQGLNVDYVATFLGRDWGWWRTVTANLDKLAPLIAELALPPAAGESISAKLRELRAALENAPKSVRWRMR